MTASATVTSHGATPLQVASRLVSPRRRRASLRGTMLPKAARIELFFDGEKLPGWKTGSGPRVLLIHGWEGASGDLSCVAGALNAAGLQTISFDFPAHGDAAGQIAHLPIMIDATLAAVEAYGPFYAVVGHGAGAAAVTIAMERNRFAERVVLISPPARYLSLAIEAARSAGLSEPGIELLMRHLVDFGCDPYGVDAANAAVSLSGVPALILHSRDDLVVSIDDGRELGAAWPAARLVELDGLGHRDILTADEPLGRLSEFLAPGSWLGTFSGQERYPMVDYA